MLFLLGCNRGRHHVLEVAYVSAPQAALRDQVAARYNTLNIPAYWAGINPELTASVDANGRVIKAEISYPRDFVRQQLRYSGMYTAR